MATIHAQAIEVHDGISWNDHPIECGRCQNADTSWRLRLYTPPWTHGYWADMECGGCDQVAAHPLIYPRMILAVLAAANGGRDVLDAVDEIDWRPHRPEWRESTDSAELHQLTWWPWDAAASRREWWATHWPLIPYPEGEMS